MIHKLKLILKAVKVCYILAYKVNIGSNGDFKPKLKRILSDEETFNLLVNACNNIYHRNSNIESVMISDDDIILLASRKWVQSGKPS